VVAVTSTASKAPMLRSLGADAVVLARDGAAYHRDPALAGGVDVALEAVGAPTFLSALRALRPAGRLVLVGNVTAPHAAGSKDRDKDKAGEAQGTLALPLGLAILNSLEIIGSDRCASSHRTHAHARACTSMHTHRCDWRACMCAGADGGMWEEQLHGGGAVAMLCLYAEPGPAPAGGGDAATGLVRGGAGGAGGPPRDGPHRAQGA
jgi:threonine dehydrogenase-like Zn-dependent dehydrogenase